MPLASSPAPRDAAGRLLPQDIPADAPACGDPVHFLQGYELSATALSAARRETLARVTTDPQSTFTLCRYRAGTALAITRACPFDSTHLGCDVHRLTMLTAWGRADAGALRDVLARAMERARGQGAALLLAAFPEQDRLLAQAAADSGLLGTGTKQTWLYRSAAPGTSAAVIAARPRSLYRVRPYRDADLPVLVSLAPRIRATQLHRIPGIEEQRVTGFYAAWIREACTGNFADVVVVAEGAAGPVGFLAYKRLADSSRWTGLELAGHGIAAVSRTAPGAGAALYAGAIRCGGDEGPFDGGEFDMDSEHSALIALVKRLDLKLLRGIRTYAAWLADVIRPATDAS